MQAHPFATCELDPETYGAALVPFAGAFVVGRNGITDEQAQAWLAEQHQLGERGEFYFTSTQLCFTATKPRRLSDVGRLGRASVATATNPATIPPKRTT